MKTYITIFAIAILLAGCNQQSKKLQRLEAEVKVEIADVLNKDINNAAIMDEVTPSHGFKYTETRKPNADAPPVVINFANSRDVEGFDLADYYSKVSYVKLKHPNSNGRFLYNTSINVPGGYTMRSSDVYLTPNNIVAGDRYMGFHCYDPSGNFKYTIASMSNLPEYNSDENSITLQYSKLLKLITSAFSIIGDNCLVVTVQGDKQVMYCFDMNTQKTYLRRPLYGQLNEMLLIAPDKYITSNYYPFDPNTVFLRSFSSKGDSLCVFPNYNSKLTRINKRASYPDNSRTYYYNDMLTIRQGMNDTVYRVSSESELNPAYVMNFGNKKVSVDSAIYGAKIGQHMPNRWLEAKDFIFIVNDEYVVPEPNKPATIPLYYSFDKQTKTLSKIKETTDVNNFWINNSISNGIPLSLNFAKSDGKRLYAKYTKAQLEEFINSPNFSKLSQAQQTQVKSLHSDLDEKEMLVMILE